MHWCMDETLAFLAMIPFIGYFFRKLHAWYHTKMGHACHEKHCDDTHVEHKEFEYSPGSPYHPDNRHKPVIISEADMEYLRGIPVPLNITFPVSIWDAIDQKDVVERFGQTLVDFLYEEVKDAGFENVTEDEVYWYVNEKAELWAEVRDKSFYHDQDTCEYGWRVEE